MTEDELLELGGWTAALLSSPQFSRICQTFETDCVHMMLGTKPDANTEREELYSRINGVRAFLGFMADFAKQAHQIDEANKPKPEDIDTQEVHDIYKP